MLCICKTLLLCYFNVSVRIFISFYGHFVSRILIIIGDFFVSGSDGLQVVKAFYNLNIFLAINL